MIDKNELDKIAMSKEEYDLVLERLGREPTHVELGMFSALWSEHCGYKHTRPLFSFFPTEAKHVLTKAGAENAGAIDLGDDDVAVFKVESHNHPSAVEPYEGAATGVGGILRDIFAMGMRPIALLDSLRFGNLKDSRTQYLFNGVVSGISGYGNCIGVPTVGGEIFFDNSYTGNPLVNVMCVGVGKKKDLVSATASGKDNLLILVGADTGRDGIHGATFASVDLSVDSVNDRPAVQVGNPFLEKLLMEACVELAQNHKDWIIGIQDLGAAGLTSSILEAAERGGCGVEINTSAVPQREIDMNPYEIMLSESQERMLIITKKEHQNDVINHFKHWELDATIIGKIIDGEEVIVRHENEIVARTNINFITNAPTYKLNFNNDLKEYDYYNPNLEQINDIKDANQELLEMLSLPNICNKKSVFRQYDHQVLNNTIIKPGYGAAVIRIPNSNKALAITTDCNSRKVTMNPYTGSEIAVAEAARNLIAVGAKPLALSDCLNFGNPDKPTVAFQLSNAVQGISSAATILDIPVVSGNASLYNDTITGSIAPTPVIGMIGIIEGLDDILNRKIEEQQHLFIAGSQVNQKFDSLAGSEYYYNKTKSIAGKLVIDLVFEKKLQDFILDAFSKKMIKNSQDISDGGLMVALAEMCINYSIGFSGNNISGVQRIDSLLFGETESRFLISVPEHKVQEIIEFAESSNIPYEDIGTFVNDSEDPSISFGPINLKLSKIKESYNSGL